jgi:hypothetical protein
LNRYEFGYTVLAEIVGVQETVLMDVAPIDHLPRQFPGVGYGAVSCSAATLDGEA